MAKRIILSLDGGGVRGIIPAYILAHMEDQPGVSSIAKSVDMIAGTSIGGLLALGLTRPGEDDITPLYSAQELLEQLRELSATIFERAFLQTMRARVFGDELYTADGLEEALKGTLEDAMLSEALCEVLVPAYDIVGRRAHFFKRSKARRTHDPQDHFMWEVARATSAAPTYFEPFVLEINNLIHAFIDGGVFANNPAMCAYAEARERWPDDEIFLISIGTGDVNRSLSVQKSANWGVLGWGQHILDLVWDGVGETVDYQLRQLLQGHYVRLQCPLTNASQQLDDTRVTNIDHLCHHAQEVINAQTQEFDTAVRWLREGSIVHGEDEARDV